MDVLEELLVLQVLGGEAGEPLEGGVHEGEPVLHVVRDHPFAHGGGDGRQVPPGGGGLGAAPAEPPQLEHQGDQQGEAEHDARGREDSQGGGGEGAGQVGDGRDHGSDLYARDGAGTATVPKIHPSGGSGERG